MADPLHVRRLGLVEYRDGLELQRQFQDARKQNLVPDTMLLLEHPPVLTLGRGARQTNIIAPAERLEALGVETFDTDRGGDVTYHGPGQIVGYPLLHLGPGKQDVRKYVRSIEELMIRTVADFGITATRIEKWPGVWVEHSKLGGPRKIAALGVHLSRWYTKHGFALNVAPELSHFELIVPCGIREAGVTSIAEETGTTLRLSDVEERIMHHARDVFGCEPLDVPHDKHTVSVTVRDDAGRVLLLKRTEARGGFWQPVTGSVERGESAYDTALRELVEETALPVPVRALSYEHAFAFKDSRPPIVCRETAFGARASGAITLDPAEHSAFEWVSQAEALSRVPHAGLARAIRLS
jgi:lipoyl(octanoyl) transferase